MESREGIVLNFFLPGRYLLQTPTHPGWSRHWPNPGGECPGSTQEPRREGGEEGGQSSPERWRAQGAARPASEAGEPQPAGCLDNSSSRGAPGCSGWSATQAVQLSRCPAAGPRPRGSCAPRFALLCARWPPLTNASNKHASLRLEFQKREL